MFRKALVMYCGGRLITQAMLRLKSEFHKGSSHFTWLNHHGNRCYMQHIQASTKLSWFLFN